MNDPYQVLGVSRNASTEEIKEAYKQLAKKYHPDNYAASPLEEVANEKMKEVNEAYDAIMNERKAAGGASYQANGHGRVPAKCLPGKLHLPRHPSSDSAEPFCRSGRAAGWGAGAAQGCRMVFFKRKCLLFPWLAG